MAAAAGVRSGWRSSITKKGLQRLNVCISWAESSSNLCTETVHSFGFAPAKHQLSPPISLVMSALLIQRGAWRARAQMVHRLTAFSRVSAESACWVSSEVYVRTKQKLGLKLKTWANLLEFNWESKRQRGLAWENRWSRTSPESSKGTQGNDEEGRVERGGIRQDREEGLLLCLRVS